MQHLEEDLDLEVLETDDILGQVNHKQGYSRAMGEEVIQVKCGVSQMGHRPGAGVASKTMERSWRPDVSVSWGLWKVSAQRRNFLPAFLKCCTQIRRHVSFPKHRAGFHWVCMPVTYLSWCQ